MAGHIRCAFRQFDTPTSNLGMTTHPRDLIKQNRNRNHHRGCLHIPSSPPPHTPGPDLESSAGPTAAGPRLLTEWHCYGVALRVRTPVTAPTHGGAELADIARVIGNAWRKLQSGGAGVTVHTGETRRGLPDLFVLHKGHWPRPQAEQQGLAPAGARSCAGPARCASSAGG